MSKKITIPSKPNRAENINAIDDWITGDNSSSSMATKPTKKAKPAKKPVSNQSQTISKKTSTTKAKTSIESEKIKRLTLDIPASLHKKIKSTCVAKGESMADVLRGILEDKF